MIFVWQTTKYLFKIIKVNTTIGQGILHAIQKERLVLVQNQQNFMEYMEYTPLCY